MNEPRELLGVRRWFCAMRWESSLCAVEGARRLGLTKFPLAASAISTTYNVNTSVLVVSHNARTWDNDFPKIPKRRRACICPCDMVQRALEKQEKPMQGSAHPQKGRLKSGQTNISHSGRCGEPASGFLQPRAATCGKAGRTRLGHDRDLRHRPIAIL